MKTIVEFYDHELLNNIINILAFKPERAVFLYDKTDVSTEILKDIERACKTQVGHFKLTLIEIDGMCIQNIYEACKKIITSYPECYVDITGGGEFAAIGAYLACAESFVPIFKINFEREKLISAYGCEPLETAFSLPRLSMETILTARGASIGGHGHPQPDPAQYDALLRFSGAVFNDIKGWKNTCSYLQTGSADFYDEKKPLLFSSPESIHRPDGMKAMPDRKFLELAQELGLIYGLRSSRGNISFAFSKEPVKKYMTDFGTWLELYCYIELMKSDLFDDVRLSLKINWEDPKKVFPVIANEIDVTFFSGIHPVFLSCKLSEPSPEALYEMSVYSTFFGGMHSKCILVTLSDFSAPQSNIAKRAQDMGISIIGGSTIRTGHFLDAVQKAVL